LKELCVKSKLFYFLLLKSERLAVVKKLKLTLKIHGYLRRGVFYKTKIIRQKMACMPKILLLCTCTITLL